MTTWYSNSDMGMVLYMDRLAADELFGMTTSTDDKIVFIGQDPDTDEPVIFIQRPDAGDFTETKLSWHTQNEYFQINVPWTTNHGRKKRAMVDSTIEKFTDDDGSEMRSLRYLIPKVAADPAALQQLLRKLNSLIDDETMVVRVKDNRIRIAVSMELGE